MRRVCFTLQVVPELIEEYRRRHAEVWPDMLRALRATGWRDYSLFLRDDGLLVGTLVTDDLGSLQAAMEKTNVNALWQADMARFFVALPGGRPDNSMVVLTEIFNLDDQLARIENTTESADE